MAVSPNGVGTRVPTARRSLVLRSETVTYTLTRPDGEKIELTGYKKGPGTPLPVLIDVDEALATCEENEPTSEERGSAGDPTTNPPTPPTPGTLSNRRYLAKLRFAERTLRRMMLQAVLYDKDGNSISLDDANILASDDGLWKDILVELAWRQSDAELEQMMREPADEGEVEAGPDGSTGPAESPDGSTVTATTPSLPV